MSVRQATLPTLHPACWKTRNVLIKQCPIIFHFKNHQHTYTAERLFHMAHPHALCLSLNLYRSVDASLYESSRRISCDSCWLSLIWQHFVELAQKMDSVGHIVFPISPVWLSWPCHLPWRPSMFNSYKPSARGAASTGRLLVLGHRHSATLSLKGFIRAQVVAMTPVTSARRLPACGRGRPIAIWA